MKKSLYPLLAFALLALAASGCAAPAPLASTPAPTAALAPTSTPTPAPTPAPTPVPTPFSMVWLSDTQNMAYSFEESLVRMGQWIEASRDELNIVCILQTGDAVESGFNPKQWAAVDGLLNQCRDIPYFAIAGNHEIGVNRHDYSAWLARPNVLALPEEQKFQGGRAAYARLTAGGVPLLLIGAGWEAELDAADWMNGILAKYPGDTAILLLHGYMDSGGDPTVTGKKIKQLVVAPNPTIKLILSGHIPGHFTKLEHFDMDGDGVDDRTVVASEYDYTTAGTRNGQMRILTFDPGTRTLSIFTYSPVTDCYYRDGGVGGDVMVFENAF